MSELKDFFVASVGAAAALIGLLFVAITLAPERVFGSKADSTQHGRATGAFIALANVFFVSLAALVPKYAAQIIIVFALSSMWQIGRESFTMSSQFPNLRGRHRFGITSFAIYVLEVVLAVRFALDAEPPEGLIYTILGLYGYALGTSWQLLRARDPDAT